MYRGAKHLTMHRHILAATLLSAPSLLSAQAMGNLMYESNDMLWLRQAEQPVRATIQRVFENGERAVELLRKLQRIETYELKDYPGTAGILDIERSSKIPG